MKKKESTFIAGILIFAVILWIGMYLIRRGQYGSIHITVNGEVYGSYSLAEDRIIPIGDTNVCEIRDGQVRMIEADCPDHLCMKQKIDSRGGAIVCLPNKVVIEGEKASGSHEDSPEFDAVT